MDFHIQMFSCFYPCFNRFISAFNTNTNTRLYTGISYFVCKLRCPRLCAGLLKVGNTPGLRISR